MLVPCGELMIEGPESSRLLIVNDSIGRREAGGVQLVARSVIQEAVTRGLAVTECYTEDVLREILNDDSGRKVVVYLQQSGELSSNYKKLAGAWLSAGATVIEKNVFARASRHRPEHKNYHMALMSYDGAARYSLRSALVGHRQSQYSILPNPLLHPNLGAALGKAIKNDGEIVLLRIGRPDPIKWRDFELDFAERLASDADLQVRLIRVGAPETLRRSSSRVIVEDLDYGSDLLGIYPRADIYLHYSAIGETFGNTIAEAIAADLPVILAQDLAWDSASVELLRPHIDFAATKRSLLKNPKAAVQAALAGPTGFAGYGNHKTVASMSVAQFVDSLLRVGHSAAAAERTPHFFASVRRIGMTGTVIGARRGSAVFVALLLEPVRAFRHGRQVEK